MPTSDLKGGGIGGSLYPQDNAPVADLSKPPIPPSPVPPPTKVEVVNQPVRTQHRMADEGPDGKVRDTSSEAVSDPNRDLGFRNLDDEAASRPSSEPSNKPGVETKPEAVPPETPPEQKPPEPPKVYAGKFKTAEDLEKSYQELERKLTQTSQEKAALTAQVQAKPPEPAVKTAEQLATDQAENNRILNELVANPKEYIEKNIVQRVTTALTAQQLAAEWRKNNPDIAEHEVRVTFEAALLTQSDPELARNPAALLNKATDNFRAFSGKIRTEGAKEALTTETRVIPLLSNTAPSAATEQPSQKAPLTPDESFAAHMKMLKEQEQRSHRGLRR